MDCGMTRLAFVLSLALVPCVLASRPLVGRANNIAEPTVIWVPQDVYKGDTFFDEWDFFSDPDPTHGMVNYLPRERAMNKDKPFAFSENGQVVMRVDNWTTLEPGQYRDSVRISSKKVYNSGLFILDVAHSPYGCSVWPGYWTLGMAKQWPGAGEIDILEGVHNNQHDQVTWHTDPGCNLTAPETNKNFSGTAISTNCYANEVGGCGIVDWSRASYGPLFNALGGGVYAMRWDPAEGAIDVWFFYRAAVPGDITIGAPNPTRENWGLPSATLTDDACDLKKYFIDHAIIFDITICGDWAGASYQQDGCPGRCEDRVMDPTSFDNASWVINSLSVYQKKTIQGRVTNGGASTLPGAALSLSVLMTLLCASVSVFLF